MKNLRGYGNNGRGKREKNEGAEELLRSMGMSGDKVNEYAAMDESELISSLIAAVKRSKEDGSFNPAQMQAFISIVSPHLSSEQRKKLESVISVISE